MQLSLLLETVVVLQLVNHAVQLLYQGEPQFYLLHMGVVCSQKLVAGVPLAWFWSPTLQFWFKNFLVKSAFLKAESH